jgi:IMP dehydrogenase
VSYLTQRHGINDVLSRAFLAGATSLDGLHEAAVIGVQGAAGYSERMPLPTGW